MGYVAYLRNLLRPLGVYNLAEDSFSGAELAALGMALDELDAYAQKKMREALVMTAEEDGLATMESLFPYLHTGASAEDRRGALSGFLQVSGDSFTVESLCRCLSACGTECLVFETDVPNTVCVRFPKVAGEPENLAEKKKIIESILPCHLQVEYAFNWCTWENAAALTFGDAGKMTFLELSMWNV